MLSIGKTLTEEQRLDKAAVAIMSEPRYVALAGILLIGSRRICDVTTTACTDGRDEMYGRTFVASLSDAELRFLVLHENYHKMYRHLRTYKWMYDINPQAANMACDHVINLKILSENFDGFAQMPKDKDGNMMGLADPKYTGWDSPRVFKDICANPPPDGQSDQSEDQGAGLDSHNWEGAQDLSEGEAQALADEIDEAIRQGAIQASKTGNSDEARKYEDLMEKQIDWREALRQFITSYASGHDLSTWKRPNKKYIGAGIYLPSTISESVEEITVAIDTSYSIQQRELTLFLSELAGVCSAVTPERLRILYWGTSVSSEELYEGHEIHDVAKSTKPRGGGGTDVNCVCAHIADKNIKSSCVIVLTDGYLGGSWGTWTSPVMWCVLDNKAAKPDCGVTVHIKSTEMR